MAPTIKMKRGKRAKFAMASSNATCRLQRDMSLVYQRQADNSANENVVLVTEENENRSTLIVTIGSDTRCHESRKLHEQSTLSLDESPFVPADDAVVAASGKRKYAEDEGKEASM